MGSPKYIMCSRAFLGLEFVRYAHCAVKPFRVRPSSCFCTIKAFNCSSSSNGLHTQTHTLQVDERKGAPGRWRGCGDRGERGRGGEDGQVACQLKTAKSNGCTGILKPSCCSQTIHAKQSRRLDAGMHQPELQRAQVMSSLVSHCSIY